MADETSPQPGQQFTQGQNFQPQQPSQSVAPSSQSVPPQPVMQNQTQPVTSPEPVAQYMQPQPTPVAPIQVVPPIVQPESPVMQTNETTTSYLESPEEAPVSPYSEPGARYSPGNDISWTASEYIAYEKSARWYIALGVTAIIMSVLLYFLTSRSIISAIVPIVGAVLFAVYGRRPPQELEYQLTNGVLSVGPKVFPLESFRSFGVINEAAFSTILFTPLKRFAPPLSIYYSPEDQDVIVDYLSTYLPIEEHTQDMIERLMHRIRF
jgi:hypothetical protein